MLPHHISDEAAGRLPSYFDILHFALKAAVVAPWSRKPHTENAQIRLKADPTGFHAAWFFARSVQCVFCSAGATTSVLLEKPGHADISHSI